jgi:putative transposase
VGKGSAARAAQPCDGEHDLGDEFNCFQRAGAAALQSQLRILLRLVFLPRAALIAEILFLRKQLAVFQERKARSRRATNITRLTMIALGRLFDWREALVIVRPETFVRRHRSVFRMLWRWKSKPRGRPPLPKHLKELIREMAASNPIWGEERIAAELLLKLGIRVSPRTVRKYLDSFRPRGNMPSQQWSTFVRNHAKGIVACDFMVTVTASMRIVYVFVAMEVGSRRILHTNVTAHPTAEWTVQQFREFPAYDHHYGFLIHDRDSIFSAAMDASVTNLGVRVLKTPVRAPKANAFCERLIGTLRRECLEFLIPLNEGHLKRIVKEYVTHYNRGRPHSALGPGIPESPQTAVSASPHRHELPQGHCVVSTPVLGGLHHEYRLEKEAA